MGKNLSYSDLHDDDVYTANLRASNALGREVNSNNDCSSANLRGIYVKAPLPSFRNLDELTYENKVSVLSD